MEEFKFIKSNPITISNPKFPPPPILLFYLPCIPQKSLPVRHVASSLFPPRKTRCPSLPAGASSAGCGGWDELALVAGEESAGPGESTRDFLVALGIYDKRLAFSFLLGIIAAFSVSRVRVSSIVVFPASVLVFAVGFFCGFFREFGGIEARNEVKDETLRVYSENLKRLLGFFDGFDAKADDFKSEVQDAIDRREIGLGDLEKYVGVIESMKLFASDARSALEGSVRGSERLLGGSVPVENQKWSSGKKNVVGEVGVGFLQVLGSLFGGSSVGSKSGKLKEKETVKEERVVGVGDDQSGGNGKGPGKRRNFGAVASEKEDRRSRGSQSTGYNCVSDWERDRRYGRAYGNGRMKHMEADRTATRFSHSEQYSYQNDSILLTNDDYVSRNMERNDEIETRTSHDSLVDSVDFSVSSEEKETEPSFVRGTKFSNAYRSSHTRMMMMEEEAYHFQSRKSRESSATVWLEDDEFMLENEVQSSSSVVSDDVMFDRYLTEANDLLQQAKFCIKGRRNEDRAEVILYQSAELLTKAITMKPTSLLAVGQLGNTYLLHGELKLRISRELRTVLIRRGPLSAELHRRILKVLDDQVVTKDKIKSALVNTCEECEELLVEAGRKYRFALSIDGNDVRALYNWGLALSFRAQLIADIGPEAALDADKVFLAAIDKFDAMMSKGNVYAPDALYRWGMTLQQRSRLRPSTSRERMKLLQQAKRLYEDALSMDRDNSQVRGALLSCASELQYRNL